MTDTTCNHWKCSDDATETIHIEGGDTGHLCEDHAHMTVEGGPTEDYEPNDPEKFDL